MDSFSRKIVLSLVLTIAFCTAIGAIWLPKFLEQSEGTPLKQLDGAPSANFSEEDLAKAVTRFPTRSFTLSSSGSSASTSSDTGSSPEMAPTETGLGGLPTRAVPGVNEGEAIGERVTTRAYLRANASVYSRPNMTAQVLGTVSSQTKVRWLDKAGSGWEEILLKSGQSAFVQSKNLSFSQDSWSTHQTGFDRRQGDTSGPDVAVLPSTVESWLSCLSDNDLLRAETFLSPTAPRLEESGLGGLAPYAGSPPEGRVLRIELASGERSTYRRVLLVYGHEMAHQVSTTWEWDLSQRRWLLVRW